MNTAFSPVSRKSLTRFWQTILLSLAALFIGTTPIMAAGPVILNEFAPNVQLSDADREWIELYNASDEAVSLAGWKLADANDEFIFPNISILAHDTLLLCRNGNSDDNGGLHCDLDYDDGFALTSVGTLTLQMQNESDAWVDVDTLNYRSTPGDSTLPQRDNETLDPELDEDENEVYESDETNEYDEDTDENTGTPGEITVADLLNLTSKLGTLESVIDIVSESEALETDSCDLITSLRTIEDESSITLFAPTDSAISKLPADELQALQENPDELCEFLAYHVTTQTVPKSGTIETLSGDLVSTMWNGDDQLLVSNNRSLLDGHAKVTKKLTADNGSLYVIDDTLLPKNPALTIDKVKTTNSSPMLSGTYDQSAENEFEEVCIIVRVNGTPYVAEQDSGVWSIPGGVVTINSSGNHLTAVMRSGNCDDVLSNNPCDCDGDGDLLALTMTRDVTKEKKDDGEVKGDDDVKPQPKPAPEQEPAPMVLPAYGKGVGKGGFGFIGTNGNGNGDGTDDGTNGENGENGENGLSDDDVNGQNGNGDDAEGNGDGLELTEVWPWLFLGAGTVALLWYALWRKPEA